MSNYDIIIIGSGLGSLECAAILSKEGYNVCVLEKNERFGGCFQTYQRQGHLLDTGIHYVGSLGEGQIMNQYFRYFGIMDKLRLQKLDEAAFDRIHHNGGVYDYAMGHDRFVETLCESFPQERENLKRYVAQLQEVGNLISVDHLKKGVIAVEGMKYFSTSAAGLIADMTSNTELQDILAGSALLYGGLKDVSTFYGHAMVNNSYIEGAYRFVDGSMQVSDELIKVIRSNGGTVRNLSEVTRIVVENEQVTGVEVNGKSFSSESKRDESSSQPERLEAKYVIAGMHPQQTLALLDKNRSIKNAYVSRINSLENTYGIFTLYLIMKENRFPYQNRNIYLHGNNDVWYNKESSPGRTTNCMISMQASSTSSPYADVISILTPMHADELATWKETTPERRGEDYKAFKQEKAHQILEFVARQGIDFGDSIQAMYTTTPLSYRDYTGTVDGSAYGVIKNYKYPQIGFISTRTKLGNLFLTGQNLNVHGALGVTLTAMMTCADFLGTEYLAKKVGNA